MTRSLPSEAETVSFSRIFGRAIPSGNCTSITGPETPAISPDAPLFMSRSIVFSFLPADGSFVSPAGPRAWASFFFRRALAPDVISVISAVISACRILLYLSFSRLSIASAFSPAE